MTRTRVIIEIDNDLMRRLDRLISAKVFVNRKEALHRSIEENILQTEKIRYTAELTKLNPQEEVALAEEGMRVSIKSSVRNKY